MVFKAFFRAFLQVIDLFLTIYIWIIVARALISWVNPSPFHPLVRFLYKVTEPVLSPIRRIIPPIYGLDLSPVLVIFIIYFIKELIFQLRFAS
ncbi:MAG: YggT family protein [Caldimicrobium sp.]